MKQKLLIALTALLLTFTLTPTSTLAYDDTTLSQSPIASSEAQPRGNITGYIYKIYDKKQWKRLWSYTYNRWEEPDWTLA